MICLLPISVIPFLTTFPLLFSFRHTGLLAVSNMSKNISIYGLCACYFFFLSYPHVLPSVITCFTYSLHLVLIYSLFRWVFPDLSTITQLHPLSKIHPVSLQLLALDLLYAIYPSLVAQMVKNLPTVRETQVWSLGQEDPLEKEVTTHSSILAEKPWMEEPGRLQSMGSQRVRHSWATSLSLSDAGNDQGQKEKRASEDEMVGWHHQCKKHEPRQTPGDGEGQKVLAVHGVAKSQT